MHVKGHLVIAASGRMETSTSITDAFRKGRFHIHVDIFQFGLEFERSLFNIVKDARKPLHDLSASLSEMMPVLASICVWAMLPRISS